MSHASDYSKQKCPKRTIFKFDSCCHDVSQSFEDLTNGSESKRQTLYIQ